MNTNPTLKLVATALFGFVAFGATDLAAQSCRAPEPTMCNRTCWSARAATGSTTMGALNRAVIHHTASSSDYNTTGLTDSKARVRGVQNYHMDNNGWSDIGYHFLVDKHGNIFTGRKDSGSLSVIVRGAHDGCNSDSYGFTALGYYHPPYNNAVTTALLNGLEKAIAWRMPPGWTPTGSGSTYCSGVTDKIIGHRSVSATACPGDLLQSKTTEGSGFENAISARRSCN